MTLGQLYDWQAAGGGGFVSLLVPAVKQEESPWCMIGGLAVNHWSAQTVDAADVEVVIAAERADQAVLTLEKAGFESKRFEWSINLSGASSVSVQISTEAVNSGFSRTFAHC